MNDKYYFMAVCSQSYGPQGASNFHYSGVTKEHPFKVIERVQQVCIAMRGMRASRLGAMYPVNPDTVTLTGWQEISKEEYELALSAKDAFVADNFDSPGYQVSDD